jgi:hypothetical protein
MRELSRSNPHIESGHAQKNLRGGADFKNGHTRKLYPFQHKIKRKSSKTLFLYNSEISDTSQEQVHAIKCFM